MHRRALAGAVGVGLPLLGGIAFACGDGDDPPPQGETAGGALDGGASRDGATDAAAALTSLGPLMVTAPSPVVVPAGRDVALSAAIAGGAGPYHVAWRAPSGAAIALDGAATLNPVIHLHQPAGLVDVVLAIDVVDQTGATATAQVAVHALASDLGLSPSGDQVALGGAEVRLHALPSGDLDGLALRWTQTGGSPLVIENATTPNPAVTLPVVAAETTFVFEVTASNAASASATRATTVTAVPPPATTSAGSSISVVEGDAVRLEGVGPGPWAWTQTAGSPAVTLAGADTEAPSFVAPHVDGVARAVLTFQAASSASVAVTVEPIPALVAHAGADVTANAGDDVVLAGTGAGGVGPYTYAWTQTSGPAIVFADAAGASTKLRLPAAAADAALVLSLRVTDSKGTAATDDLDVLVKAPPGSLGDAGATHRPLTFAERTALICDGSGCQDGGALVVCDERAPFGSSVLDFDGRGGFTLHKRCLDDATCLAVWWQQTAPLDQCDSLLPPTSAPLDPILGAGTPSVCSYCCAGPSCNAGTVPALGTTPSCDERVCYPPR